MTPPVSGPEAAVHAEAGVSRGFVAANGAAGARLVRVGEATRWWVEVERGVRAD